MTKERKLAIKMWETIKDSIKENPEILDTEIYQFKFNFCAEHSLKWKTSCCWFCAYLSSCSKCPLGSCCNYNSNYRIAKDRSEPINSRLLACDNIINALKGEYHAKLLCKKD